MSAHRYPGGCTLATLGEGHHWVGMSVSLRPRSRRRRARDPARHRHRPHRARRSGASIRLRLTPRGAPFDAPAAWAPGRSMMRRALCPRQDRGHDRKFRFLKERYDAAERYIDRAEFIEVASAETDFVLEALRAAPATYAAAFALELDRARGRPVSSSSSWTSPWLRSACVAGHSRRRAAWQLGFRAWCGQTSAFYR